MDKSQIVLVFDLLTVLLTAGAVIVAVSVASATRPLVLSAAGIGASGALILGAAQPMKIGLLEFGAWTAAGIVGAVVFAFVVQGLFEIKEGTMFAIFRLIGDGAKAALAPRRWPESQDAPRPSSRDLLKRLYVAVAAGTGGVSFSLISLNLFWAALKETIGPRGLFEAILLATVSITLVGPIHEYIIDRGLETKTQHHELPDSGVLSDLSWRALLRLGLVAGLYLLLDLTMAAIAACVRDGNVPAMIQILLGGLTPAIVSYYWSAALQLGVPSVRKTATWPSVVGGAVMFGGLGLALTITMFGLLGAFAGVEKNGGFAAIALILFAVGIAALVSLAMSWVTCGTYAAAGGYAIDRIRGSHGLLALLFALMIATVPQQIILEGLIWFGERQVASETADTTAARDGANLASCSPPASAPEGETAKAASPCDPSLGWLDHFNLILGALGWFVGLLASGFPELVRRPSAAATTSVASACEAG